MARVVRSTGGGNKGSYDERWGLSEGECARLCVHSAECVAYEFAHMGRGAGGPSNSPAWMTGGAQGGIDAQGYFTLTNGRRFELPDRFGRTLMSPKESVMVGGNRPCNVTCVACGKFGHRAWECEVPRRLVSEGKISVTGGPP